MSGIVFEDFTNKNAKILYETIWQNNVFVNGCNTITKAPVGNGRASDNSYVFDSDGDKATTLINVFGIAEPELFLRKFKMACGGSGQEYRRITTLHSSSLCALLFFYNVTEKNPLKLELDAQEYLFTESFFEFKSPVINSPSNMDVVLKGIHIASGKETILFLESKFSEYYSAVSNRLAHISEGYLDNTYSKSFYQGIFWEYLHNTKIVPDTDGFVSLKSEQKYYIGGIKQMISHYTGIRNLLDGNFFNAAKTAEQATIEFAIQNGTNVILAEILFDDRLGHLKMDSGQTYLDSYANMYVKFADKAMTEISMAGLNSRFTVAIKELGYSLFKNNSHTVEDRILQFYF